MDVFYVSMVLIHILLLVFWVGTDVGVFIAAKYSEKSELSVETRATILSVGMILDRLPRSALVLIIPSGLFLANYSGALLVPPTISLPIYGLATVWLIILWRGFLTEDPAIEQKSASINFGLSAIAALAVSASAVWLLMQGQIALWLGLKLLLVGCIFALGVLLDIQFRPAVSAFTQIVSQGASEDRDSAYSKAIAPVYLTVLSIYLLAIIAAALGIAKI